MIMDIWKAMCFVHSLPFFWTSMLYATLMAMFFAATIYDGNIPHAKRGIASVLAYAFMTMLVSMNYAFNRYPHINADVAYQVFVYPVQLFYLSFFWAFGFALSIYMYRRIRGTKKG
jgi:hypothetical protein